MKPNIFFLTLDDLRTDKCYGKNKSSITPHLDSLIKNGVFFSKSISSSDQTGTSLASIFLAKFPINTGITQLNFQSDTPTFFDVFKRNGYHTYGFVPDLTFFLNLTLNFDERVSYEYVNKYSWKKMHGGLGNQIVEQFKSGKMTEPWIWYGHMMDTKPDPKYLPSEFDKEEYGKTRNDRILSVVDIWLGKILNVIDPKKTLIVISSDHGDYLPVTGKPLREIPRVQSILRTGKKIVPFLEPIGLRLFLYLQHRAAAKTKKKLKKTLTPLELRSFGDRATTHLYDELVNVPLIFSGYGIKSHRIIPNLVRQVDIIPTIADIVGLKLENKIDGRTIFPLIQGNKIEELSAYIETGVRLNELTQFAPSSALGHMIGLRTSKFKYYRSRKDSKIGLHLFDLENDPLEETNIAETEPEIVSKMENMLAETIHTIDTEKPRNINEDEQKKIEDELRKLGYI